MKRQCRAAIWAGLVTGAVLICIVLVDRPLADFAASHPVRIPGMRFILGAPGLLVGLALIGPLANWRVLNAATGWRKVSLLCSSSVLWTAATVEFVLKPLFGRSGPVSWLQYHEFAFHWFQGRQAQLRSMPSGEAALLTAVLAILWVTYPRYRWVYALIGTAEAVALVWLSWHFASDVIAGAAVGALGAGLALRRA